MITVQQIIDRALKKIGVLSATGTANTNDNALCLDALKAIYQHNITGGASGRFYDVMPVQNPYYANENERIVNDGTFTIVLPDEVPNGYYEEQYGFTGIVEDADYVRPPRDLAVIEECRTDTGVVKTNMYDNRTRKWIDVNAITYSSECPLALRDANGLASLLALAVASEFNQDPSSLVVKSAYDFQLAITENWSQAGDVIDPPDFF